MGGERRVDGEKDDPKTPKRPPPEEEPPTGESDPSSTGPAAFEDDMVSVPRARPATGPISQSVPRPGGTPPQRPGASVPPGVTRPPALGKPPADDEDDKATIHQPPKPDVYTELPTMQGLRVRQERDVETQAGAFPEDRAHPPERGTDGTDPEDQATMLQDPSEAPPSAVSPDDQATLPEIGTGTRQRALLGDQSRRTPSPTNPDPGAGFATQRSQGPVPASKFSRGTARDPVGGTAAARGTVPGARPMPTQLAEGMLLADRYELVKRLGKGGMGEVWQARHTLLQGMRAIKVIKASISRDPSFRARFLSEGQTMMRVKHEGVVEVTDLDETRANRELFMVMEYLKGRTMHDAMRAEKDPLRDDVPNAVRIFRDLAKGMQRIHDERIVHKDLKSDNVLLVTTEDGLEHPKVIDFGLAKRLDGGADTPVEQGVAQTQAAAGGGTGAPGTGPVDPEADTRTTLSGTLAYMSPEQFRGEASSFQSDLYAFGVMLYECFTKGEYPMPRGSLADYIKAHNALGKVPQRLRQARPDMDAYLADVADWCMAPTREQRPASFRDVAKKLQWWLDIPVRAKQRRNLILTGAVAAVLIGVAVYGFFFATGEAGLGPPRLFTAKGDLQPVAGRYYLAADALPSLGFEAKPGEGKVVKPRWEVDGTERPATIVRDDEGRLRAEGVDLSSLPDGDHEFAFAAGPGGAEAKLVVVVDRQAPSIATVKLSDRDGAVTNAAPPVLLVTPGEPADQLQKVYILTGAEQTLAQRLDDRRWKVSVPVTKDGPVKVQVFAVDLAGNVSPANDFAFTRDSEPPRLTLDRSAFVEGKLQVRSGSGNDYSVTSAEPVTLDVEGDGRKFTLPRSNEFRFQLPTFSGKTSRVVLTATDAAGNATVAPIDVLVQEDTVRVTNPRGDDFEVADGTAPVRLNIKRSYPLPDRSDVAVVKIARVRDADGREVPPAPPKTLSGAIVSRDVDPTKGTISIQPIALPDAGEYTVSLEGLEEARPEAPLRLLVDKTDPRISSVSVADASGRVIPDGAWSLTPDVVVSVRIDELSLKSLTLNGKAPREQVTPGSGDYTFAMPVNEGQNTWTLIAEDQRARTSSRPVKVLADLTDPTLELSAPADLQDGLTNVSATTFIGRNSERDWTLHVDGAKGRNYEATVQGPEFRQEWLLEDGTHALQIYAVDKSGRRSNVVTRRLVVQKVETEAKPIITWRTGPQAEMRKVLAGDVVIEGRTHPVDLVYLDTTEVTNAQYRQFLKAVADAGAGAKQWDHPQQPPDYRSHVPDAKTWNDPKWNADDLPVVNVSWWDAYAFAKWSGRRLPTEAEWVKAAAKSKEREEIDLRSWPPIKAGDPWKEGLLAVSDGKKLTGPVPVTSGGDKSPAELLHMGGNVSEWVDLQFVPVGEPTTGVRGGNWFLSRFAADARTPTKRFDRSARHPTIGFRCAVDAEDVKP